MGLDFYPVMLTLRAWGEKWCKPRNNAPWGTAIEAAQGRPTKWGAVSGDLIGPIGLVRRTLDSDRHPSSDRGHKTPGALIPLLGPNSNR
jgi:hypothetical protein